MDEEVELSWIFVVGFICFVFVGLDWGYLKFVIFMQIYYEIFIDSYSIA